jgi:hypothetical protein
MSLIGQWLAAVWIARREEQGKPTLISDPDVRHRYQLYSLVGLWLFSLVYVSLTGFESQGSLRQNTGQWIWAAVAMTGWAAPILLVVRKHRRSSGMIENALEQDAVKTGPGDGPKEDDA